MARSADAQVQARRHDLRIGRQHPQRLPDEHLRARAHVDEVAALRIRNRHQPGQRGGQLVQPGAGGGDLVVGEVERNVVLGHGDLLVDPCVNPASAGCVLAPPRSVWRVG